MKRTDSVSPSNVVVPYGDFVERRDRRRRVMAELERRHAPPVAPAKAAATPISRDQKFRFTRSRLIQQQNREHVAEENYREWMGVWDAHPRQDHTDREDPGHARHSVADETGGSVVDESRRTE